MVSASNTNTSEPISRVLVVDTAYNFNVDSADIRTYLDSDGFKLPTQHVNLTFKRPATTRVFTLLLFLLAWLLTHISVGQVIIARRSTGTQALVMRLAVTGGIIMVIPQLRNSMPNAPTLDSEFRVRERLPCLTA